ncbi:nuclear transport factor 2 family protein [Streptomyces antimicrobicus]|uniref:Ester cyclase n=1 Tax=Streptomyces antimicrobicus TaxID=2883108 RepID=A0ABS8B3P7_9ACTN|nr:nuclear transport factor 2 family protein [Streptomyces antimicrobicus]MCB5179243.1 ester cyclase [Streptomyces antimicrobicus]
MSVTTTPITDSAPLTREAGTRLVEGWAALWNGDVALAEQILAPGFRLYFADDFDGTGSGATFGQDELKAFITANSQALTGLTFAADAAPLVDAERGEMACRWSERHADGDADVVLKSGIDMFAVTDGRISAVWSLTGNRRFAA